MIDSESQCNLREQRFLAGQRERLKQASQGEKQEQRRKAADGLLVFWSALRSELDDWNQRLEGLQEQQAAQGGPDHVADDGDGAVSGTPRSSDANVRQDLIGLRQELYNLRSHCFSMTSTATTPQSTDSTSATIVTMDVPKLPATEWKLLHTEFSKHFERWETIKEQILPKGKFVFRRYREAIAKQQQQQQQQQQNAGTAGVDVSESASASEASVSSATAPNRPTAPILHTNRSVITGYFNCTIRVHRDGSVSKHGSLQRASKDSSYNSNSGSEETLNPISMSALCIEDLRDCTIEIQKSMEAIYIRNIQNSVVVFYDEIRTALHATGCHQSRVQNLSCQQIRLHECTQFILQVSRLSSTAILEGCTKVTFDVVDPIDVKDFDWLRIHVSSPNFVMNLHEHANWIPKLPVQQQLLPAQQGPQSKVEDATSNTGEVEHGNLIEAEIATCAQSPSHGANRNGELGGFHNNEYIRENEEEGGGDDDDEL